MTRPIALVTGASSGIGLAFARRLARDGHDLVLVARREGRLKELADELRPAHGAAVEILTADLTDADDLARVEARLATRDHDAAVDLLVNNAGFGTIGPFAEQSVADEEREIRLNVLALVRLAHAAVPAMLERNRGGILNVASIAGLQPSPFNATYSGTKAFVVSFSEALHEELRGSGVRVTVLCPGFTRTEFQEVAGAPATHMPGFMWQSAEAVVDHALRDLRRGTAVSVPGLHNAAAATLARLLPRSVARRVAGIVSRRLES